MPELQDPYLSRRSEQLVLEGYRFWSSGIITGDERFLQRAWDLFSRNLGMAEGQLALDALTKFTRTLGLCATCPLKTNHIGCPHLCRDEVLILGLLAGIQHNCETTIILCLDELSCPSRCQEVIEAAEIFATTLKTLGRTLVPVPAGAIKSILSGAANKATLH